MSLRIDFHTIEYKVKRLIPLLGSPEWNYMGVIFHLCYYFFPFFLFNLGGIGVE